mgnify:CR=1 FL=1
MYKIYSLDLESMRYLSFVSEALLKNGLTIPGNVNVEGNLTVNQSQINDEIKKEVFSKEITVEKFSDTYLIFPTTPEFEITPIPSSIPSIEPLFIVM